MTSNNETVSRQNLLAVNIAKSMTSEGNSPLFRRMLTVDRRYSEIKWISSFKTSNYMTVYNNLKAEFSGKRPVIKCLILIAFDRVIVEVIFSSSDSFC